MADRYFVESPIHGESARLVAGEAHHLMHVMRAAAGDEVTLFDGSGAEFLAQVQSVARAGVELAILSRDMVDRELRVPLILGAALPKGDRGRWLVEKATELGVARVVPLATEHTEIRISAAAAQKLRRAVIEASKQCGRNRLMEIAAPRPLDEFLSDVNHDDLRLIAHPTVRGGGSAPGESIPSASGGNRIVLAIGPEGGFTPAEIDTAQARGWQVVDLGPRILRVETAAVALTSAIVVRLKTSS